jgi:mono/diheme cytochrome c family protein
VFLVGLGGILAVVIWSHKNKTENVADSSQSEADPDFAPRPRQGARPGRQGPSGPQMASANPAGANPRGAPGQVGAQTNPGAAGGIQDFAAGKRVFTQHCARCHSVGGAGGPGQVPGGGPGGPGGGPGGRNRGPDLSTTGRDPNHTVDWLMAFVREPTSVKPRSRMPGFEGKITEPDLRALAEYLASLK